MNHECIIELVRGWVSWLLSENMVSLSSVAISYLILSLAFWVSNRKRIPNPDIGNKRLMTEKSHTCYIA